MPCSCATTTVAPSAAKALKTIQTLAERLGLDAEGTIVSGQ
jgi:hypothetical protein